MLLFDLGVQAVLEEQPARVGLDRATPGHLIGRATVPDEIEALAELAHRQLDLAIQHQPEGGFRVVMHDEDDRTTKVGVGQLWHRHQE